MSAGAAQGRLGRALMVAAIIAVVATVAGALLVMDPPGRQRAERLDARRVDDLQVLEARISAHYRLQDALPRVLSDVAQGPGQSVRDPVTREPYGYEVTGPSTYRLCARFETASDGPAERYLDAWRHATGSQCFDLDAGGDARPPARAVSPAAVGKPLPPAGDQ